MICSILKSPACLLLWCLVFPMFALAQGEPELVEKNKPVNGLFATYTVLKDKKSVKQGAYVSYYENDSLAEKGQYDNDERVGIWEYYGRDGKLIEKFDYNNNKSLFLKAHYDENGKFYFSSQLFEIAQIDQMPVFQGGYFQFLRYIERNIHYPEDAKEKGVQGTVIVSFEIQSDGKIEFVKLASGIKSVSCNDEAIRLIKKMPAWHPGWNKGKAVPLKYYMPVTFKLK